MARSSTIGLIRTFCLLLLLVMAAPTPVDAGGTPLSTRRIASGVSRPVMVAAPEGDFERLFIVQQQGVIRVYDMTNAQLISTPFLDINSIVGGGTSGADERGLLGLAFHPNYATNGFFYVYYTNNSSNTTVARYSVSATNPDVATSSSAQIVLTQNQPFSNHNGGMIAFGPNDGYLYIGLGDGGSSNDPQGNGQNTNTRLGKMLRIDVDGGSPFAIPPDNPFAGPGAPLDEIWAYGLRNPWRFSFDRDTGDMYIADVGQFSWEEVDIQPGTSSGGENYGWRCMEGNNCTGLSGYTCNASSLTDPVQVYSHGSGCSITGGNVYRGCAMPDMHGIYFYADWCSNQIWSFVWNGTSATQFTTRTTELNPPGSQSISGVAGFGEDAYGEIYICDWNGGEIFKIVPADIDSLDLNGNFIVDSCECS
ncbi:MAG: PQQ-dependent sugar dehydrogenase, partial [Planctomycetota bacterium]